MDNESREMFQQILSRLDKMDNRFDKMDGRLDKMDGRLDKMDNRFDILELKQNRTAKKLEDLRYEVTITGKKIIDDVQFLRDEMETVIAVMKHNELLPQ